jgi:hypothetical protein
MYFPVHKSASAKKYDIQVLKLQYEKEFAQSHVTVQTKFNYSWGLVKSPLRDHQVEGVRLLQGLHWFCNSSGNKFTLLRYIPDGADETARVLVLSSTWTL